MSSRSSIKTSTRKLPDNVVVGRVRRPHGVAGELAVEVLTDVADRFAPGSELRAVIPGGEVRRLRVASARAHRGGLLIGFEEIGSREEAEAWRDATLEAERRQAPAAPGSFYYYELVDCVCRDSERGELGRVVEVREDGGGLLLEVEGGGRRLLVPFVAAMIVSVDVEGGVIEVDLPAGLIEACASTS